MKHVNPTPGRYTRLLLRITLPILTLWTVALLISYLDARAVDPVKANLHYPSFVEYILSSAVIVAIGAFICAHVEKKNE